jgi:DNA-binding NarL/FixJ family response regulator
MRVLVADDHEIIRKATLRILQSRADLECAEAGSAKEAVRKAVEWSPDLIVLDISMPGVGGFEAAREIKQHLPNVPILFFSIYDDADYLETARCIGQGVVFKEQAGTILLKAVDALLRKETYFPDVENSSK